MTSVSIVAIIFAALANMIVGSLWYSKMLFAKQWMKLIGKNMSDMKGVQKAYVLAAVVSLIEAYVLAVFLQMSGAVGLTGALKTAFWVWVGFIATTQSSSYIFEGRPLKLYNINAGYQLVSFLVMSMVLSAIH